MVLNRGGLGRFDHRTARKGVELASLLGWIGVNGVGEFWATQEKEEQEKRRKEHAAKEGDERVKRTYASVHVAVNVASDDDYSDLCDEETDDDEADHGANRLPRRRGLPHR